MPSPDRIALTIQNTRQPIRLTLSTGGGSVPYYDGPTEVTPSQETQTLYTSGLRMPANVIINPIPPDWGHVLFNGFRLRVE